MTILEYINLLPEPIKSKALVNYDPIVHDYTGVNNGFEFVSYFCQWDKTPEGYNYWNFVCENFDEFLRTNNPSIFAEIEPSLTVTGKKDAQGKIMTTEVDATFVMKMMEAMSINKWNGKYERGNHYKKIDALELFEAMERHLLALKAHYQETGNFNAIDECGVNHIYLIATNAMMLDIQNRNNEKSI